MTEGENCEFSFKNLRPGPYLVREIIQDGWHPTTPVGGYTFLELDSNDVAQLGFGNVQPSLGTIHGLKFHDLDRDGRKDDGEPVLPGWEIVLRTSDHLSTTVTDAGGHYAFNNLPPGEYFVSEVLQPGWQQTTSCPNTAPAEGGSPECRFVWGSHLSFNAVIDFGNWQPDPGQIHGTVWHDLDGDGVRDPREPVIPKANILIISEDGDSKTTQSDEDGNYKFEDLLPGKYQVHLRIPAGWQQTYPRTGDHTIFLAPNQVVDGVDFGIWQPKPGSIHGQKFEDLDGNGVKDPDERGLAEWVIYLVDEHGHARRTLTDAKGNYWFEDVLPGKVKVGELLMYGWRQTSPKGGGHEIEVAPGQVVHGVDFGNIRSTGAYCKLPWDIAFQNNDIAIETLEIAHEGVVFTKRPFLASPDSAIAESLFEVRLEGLPAGLMGTKANGPEQIDILGPNPIAIEAGSKVYVPIGVHYPISFTEGFPGPAIFAATVTNLSTGESFGCVSKVWPARDELIFPPRISDSIVLWPGDTLDFSWSIQIPLDIVEPVSDGAANQILGSVTTDSVTISYTFSAMSDGSEDGLPGIALNGLPAGNNVQGMITVPAGLSITLGVQAGFADNLPNGPSDILLELDFGADGVIDTVSSAVIGPPEIKVYLPAINRP